MRAKVLIRREWGLTESDKIMAASAERRFMARKHIVAQVQREFDVKHARATASESQRRAMIAAERNGTEYKPAFNIALMACAMAGYEFDWLVEKTRRGFLIRGNRSAARAKVYGQMRLHGLSYPEIAHVFGTSHTTVLDAMHDLPEMPVPATVVRFGSAA